MNVAITFVCISEHFVLNYREFAPMVGTKPAKPRVPWGLERTTNGKENGV